MAAVTDLGSTFGALYLGSIVSTVLYGFTTNQAFVYFKKYYKQDGYPTQVLVLGLWAIDTFQVGLMIDFCWEYLVKGFASPAILSTIIWSFAVELGVTVSSTFFVRAFYMNQLWNLSHRKFLILVPALIFALGQLALGLQTTVHLVKDPSFSVIVTKDFQWILGSKCVCSVIADVLITTSTCYYLHIVRTGFTGTNQLIDMLSVYTVNRGVLAMLWETLVMITFLTMKTNFVFAALHLMLGKLHTASLYALLNHRDALRVRKTTGPSTFTHIDLSQRTAPRESTTQITRNVEVLVTSETVVDSTYDPEKPKLNDDVKQYHPEGFAQ